MEFNVLFAISVHSQTQFHNWVVISFRDRPKFSFSFGAEYNNLNCFGKFRFQPNIDLWLLAKIRFQPKKFCGFSRVPKVHTAVTIYKTNQTGPPDGLQSNKVYDTAVSNVMTMQSLQPVRWSGRATLQCTITCVSCYFSTHCSDL